MSHIDSFKHEIVGLFGNIPIYHPLEKIKGDFKCNPSQLLLGGGNGEHPALVIKNPTATVAWFLEHTLEPLRSDDVKAKSHPLKRHLEEWDSVVESHINWSEKAHLIFYDWSMQTHHDFYKLCISTAIPNPYPEDKQSIEEWLILGFGEFIFFAMPELAEKITSKLTQPYKHFHHMNYYNILLLPKNMPVYANGGNAFTFVNKRKRKKSLYTSASSSLKHLKEQF
jgi:hypothetical protein